MMCRKFCDVFEPGSHASTFGEEVMVENTDKALAMTCQQFGVIAIEYTVAPKFLAIKLLELQQ